MSEDIKNMPENIKTDKELLDFWENHKQYIVGFAPSGDWSAFDGKYTCYGKTIRECLSQLQVMHKEIEIITNL